MSKLQREYQHISKGGNRIINFANHNRDLYQRAIDKFEGQCGYSTLEIHDMATTNNGSILYHCSSLHSANGEHPQNMLEFWIIYDSLANGLTT